MMARRFKRRGDGAGKTFWRALATLCWLIIAAALFAWWRGGMWANGEMPTHGMIPAVAAAGAAILLIGLKAALDRWRR